MGLAEIYNTVYATLSANKYILALVVFVLFYVIAKLVIMISKNILLKIADKTKTQVDNLIIKRVNKPLSLIIFLIGIRISAVILKLSDRIETIIYQFIYSFIVIIITHVIIVVIDILIDNWGKAWAEKTKSKIDNQLLNIIHRFSKILLSILAILFILDVWGVKVGPLLASLGIAGIAVAFALKDTLGNIFGGISLIIDKTIKVGDIIELDANTKGRVLDVGLRSTKIRTFNNELIIIPNGKLANSKIENYVPPDPSVRVVVPFGVAYGSNIEKVKKIVLKEIAKIDDAMKDPEPVVRFREMANSSLNFKAYFYIDSYTKRFAAIDTANTMIYNALNKNKITIPFPQMDVHVKRR